MPILMMLYIKLLWGKKLDAKNFKGIRPSKTPTPPKPSMSMVIMIAHW